MPRRSSPGRGGPTGGTWPLLLLASLLATACGREPAELRPAPPADGELAVAPADSADVHRAVQESLHLAPPLTVAWMGKFDDGGSIGGVLRDANGQRLEFAWDGARRLPSAANYNAPRPASLGNRRFGAAGSRPLEVGGAEERALILGLRLFMLGGEERLRREKLDGPRRTDLQWRMGNARWVADRLEVQRTGAKEGRLNRPPVRPEHEHAERAKRDGFLLRLKRQIKQILS